ncbi:MAG TPA: hypothetical protein VM802_09675 [Chitinophaga sp.]|uniref:hypothetical protein n=1 Tax=Chitinophaga sp. TaxID=1869181 RepID=UPI002CDC0FD3|nr:hypothetical protein [Chitinophaga sp.]HVI45131.1 hypothetical protein [Chitinophaga sp.]
MVFIPVNADTFSERRDTGLQVFFAADFSCNVARYGYYLYSKGGLDAGMFFRWEGVQNSGYEVAFSGKR